MYDRISDIHTLDLAITSVCNAKCMDCARWWVDDEGMQYHNPRDDRANHHWPWETLCEHLAILGNITHVLICGNAGDPMAHPHVADICEWIHAQWPMAHICIDTNGSLGTVETWRRLADIPRERISVRFAVDGLEDTNHIYRRNVPWERVKHNITWWFRSRGSGTLKTIDFPWNEPDRDEIREWADDLGWEWQLDARWNPDMDQRIIETSRLDPPIMKWEQPLEDGSDWQTPVGQHISKWIAQGKPMQAECRSRGDWLYINHDHRVWPCCYWANAEYTQWERSKKHLQHLQRLAEPTWNSLDHHSLKDIINHPIMRSIDRLWQGKSIHDTSIMCIHQCGGCKFDE